MSCAQVSAVNQLHCNHILRVRKVPGRQTCPFMCADAALILPLSLCLLSDESSDEMPRSIRGLPTTPHGIGFLGFYYCRFVCTDTVLHVHHLPEGDAQCAYCAYSTCPCYDRLTLRDLRASKSSHLLAPSRILTSMTASMWALASSSRWFRHLFQAWKAPSLRVCFLSLMATVCSSRATRYLRIVTFPPHSACSIMLGGKQAEGRRPVWTHHTVLIKQLQDTLMVKLVKSLLEENRRQEGVGHINTVSALPHKTTNFACLAMLLHSGTSEVDTGSAFLAGRSQYPMAIIHTVPP